MNRATPHIEVAGSLLDEHDTILGAPGNLWTGSIGSKSWFADAKASYSLGSRWQVNASYRRGWTRLGAAGLRDRVDRMQSDAWSADLSGFGLLAANDHFAVRIAQPLRIASGGISLTLPIAYDYGTLTSNFGRQFLSLSPTGRERDVEAAYSVAVGDGFLTANGFWRHEPGHIKVASDDLGFALRFNRKF